MSTELCALIVCRDGVLPAGATDAFDFARREALVVGTGAKEAAAQLHGPGRVRTLEFSGTLRQIGRAVSTLLSDATLIVLPASPDGRDVAPLLAFHLQRPLLTSATRIRKVEEGWEISAVQSDGLLDHSFNMMAPAVVTVLPTGTTSSLLSTHGAEISEVITATNATRKEQADRSDAIRSEMVLAADPRTIDLAEADFIVAGGQGLASKDRFNQLAAIGTQLGASLGGTRVASDAGWIPFERQIGTTGVAVNPNVYIAFAISGATQHTSGLGSPNHIISVNTDPSCPMMNMSHVAIVSDANKVIDALTKKLGQIPSPTARTTRQDSR